MAGNSCKPQERDLLVQGKETSSAWKSSAFARNVSRKWELWWLLWFPVFNSSLSLLGDSRESHLDMRLQVMLYLTTSSAGHPRKLKRKNIFFFPPEDLEPPFQPIYPTISGSQVCTNSFLVAVSLNKPHNQLTMTQVLKFIINKNL